MSEFKPRYAVGSIMFWLLDTIGLLMVVGGMFLAWFMVSNSSAFDLLPRLIASLPGLGVSWAGLTIVMIATIGDAILDTANNTAEAVHVLKEQQL